MNEENKLKSKVKEYWNKKACGTNVAISEKFTEEYFKEIEEHRYRLEPEIFSFAQFTRSYGQKILEVGIGAGSDFIQWVRAGAKAYGIDITEEAVEHTKQRLSLFNLKAEEVKVSDAENIPYENNTFDLVYSWGVIHHSPNTEKALAEIIRVTVPQGRIKLMIYNRHSIYAFYKYLKYGLFRGRPFRSLKNIMFYHQESIGTKAYSIKEIKKILENYPVRIISIHAPATNYDLKWNLPILLRVVSYVLAFVLGYEKIGWFIMIDLEKV
jgi:ubiquinone/menaquinone biosynthesis C-methylase UbiE